MNQRVLLVDDDPNILQGFRRHLRKKFDLEFAEGGKKAIEAVDSSEPFAVIVSDMQMPEIDGLELLCHVRNKTPETVRIMLTGNADQKTATDAVNQGEIFRFLNKPCEPDYLAKSLEAGIEQYRLITAERELLTQTLNGSIDLLTEVLSMVNPAAFGRSMRVRDIVKSMSELLAIEDSWQLDIAAALSQIGSVTIPGEVLELCHTGKELDDAQKTMVENHPSIAGKLVGKIPRMENVGKIISSQSALGSAAELEDVDNDVREYAEILDLALTFDTITQSTDPVAAIDQLSKIPRFANRRNWLKALSQSVSDEFEFLSVKLTELNTEMILDADLYTVSGVLLVTKGQQVTSSLMERLINYKNTNRGIVQPIKVRKKRRES